ncbi:MAG: flagellar basal body-associated FliL family protein [Desulfovibrionaceae bacterium]|nr:flagellar basal body-associated FliL family protein [Desulfovibrionaceae bacterium]
MAKDKKKALPEVDDAATPKKSRKKLIIILVAILLMLTGLGVGGYWWFFLRAPGNLPDDQVAEATDGKAEEGKDAQDAKGEKGENGEAKSGDKSGGVVERPATLPRSHGMVVPLPPITVNLYDAGGRRYLKLGMEVEVNKDVSSALKANEARIRDAVIMLLAGKSYAEIASPDGKVMLKAEVANRLNQILGGQRVIRIYFTDFVVQ